MYEWLHPINIQMDYIIYASQISYELMYDSACVADSGASEACFDVAVIWNGNPLAFAEC